ncbi:MAG: hypothetical protein KGY75_05915 [Candidatus Cloacimonetes bacterium]|nr:hypothetical protein [Candidatus Cloacimonadota bacterium]
MQFVKNELKRILIPLALPEKERLLLALDSIKVLQDEENSKQAIVIAPNLGIYDKSSNLGSLLHIERRLWLSIYADTKLSLKSERTLRPTLCSHSEDIFVALFPSRKIIDFLDYLPQAQGIICVPDEKRSLEGWADIWNPYIYDVKKEGLKKGKMSKVKLNDKVLQILQKYILSFAKYDRNDLHPYDKKQTIFYFNWLRKNKIEYDVFEIRKFLLRRDSNSYTTSEICKIAKQTQNGRNFKGQNDLSFALDLD